MLNHQLHIYFIIKMVTDHKWGKHYQIFMFSVSLDLANFLGKSMRKLKIVVFQVFCSFIIPHHLLS